MAQGRLLCWSLQTPEGAAERAAAAWRSAAMRASGAGSALNCCGRALVDGRQDVPELPVPAATPYTAESVPQHMREVSYD